MKPARALLTFFMAAGAAAMVDCTTDPAEPDGFVVEASESGELRASLAVDGEEIAVAVTDHDGVRDITVTGANGTSYAVWHTQLSDLDTWGSYGERGFGRVQDSTSDGDAAAWAPIAEGRVGEVLRAVSSAAAEAEPPAGLAAEQLVTVSQIHPSLTLLARGAEEEAAYNGCWFGYGNIDIWAYCSDTGIIVGAQTYRPSSECTRAYYVQIYRESPWTYICGDGTGDGEWMRAVCARSPGMGGFRVYTSKHWDSLNPGAPIWLRDSVTCL